jgi:hypothetical protein
MVIAWFVCLYFYDPSSQPFVPQGDDVMETVKPLPAWRGFWYLVSAHSSPPSPGVATLRSGRGALVAEEDGNVDPIEVTLYSGVVTFRDSKRPPVAFQGIRAISCIAVARRVLFGDVAFDFVARSMGSTR